MNYEDKTRIHISCKSILDITADTIVNSANATPNVGTRFKGRMTLDYMIFDAAGYDAMLAERRKYGYLSVSNCCTTSSYNLSSKNIQRVIHVNVPKNDLRFDENGSLVKLAQCYYNVLLEAKKHNSLSIAFPLLGTGIKNFDEMTAIRMMKIGTEEFITNFPDYQISIIVSIISESAFKYAQFFFTMVDNSTIPFASPDFDYDEAVKKGYFSGHLKKSLIDETKMYEKLYDKTDIIEKAHKAFKELIDIKFTEQHARGLKEDNPLLEKLESLRFKRGYSKAALAERANINESQYKYISERKGRNYDRCSIIGLCFAFCLSLSESVELMQLAGFAFRDERGDILIMNGLKKMEDILKAKSKAALSLDELMKIEAEINNQLLNEKIEDVFIGNRKRYKGIIS